MKNAEIKVLSFDGEDVIATSAKCSRSGNANQLYAYYEACFWEIYQGADYANGCNGNIIASFSYKTVDGGDVELGYEDLCNYWSNGTKVSLYDENDAVATGLWFHYEEGTYYLCNNPEHQ